ncbi:lipopolysaccharide heptosyltransferase II [Endozoicomonas sp. ALE010]|uniref:lipopolysaccharide heptosyltransferase II n=1 Tax=Endozoicomonas sp. ALE010 TaxID=3403081 RepID=UPI003BB6F216
MPALQVNSNTASKVPGRYHLHTDRPILALCPGAEFGPSKQWPTGYYAEVARSLAEQGWQVWLFGSAKDQAVTAEIKSCLPDALQQHCHNMAGETSLADAIDLLSFASAVVSNDSGLMHIAAALNRPLVAVYGSTSTDHTPPMNKNSETLSMKLDRKLDSHLAELLMHLFKWQYQPQKREYGHSWENSIRAHRKQTKDLMEKYPSLEAKIISDWEGIFESALRAAIIDTDMSKEDFPENCPWTFDQIMQEDWLPSKLSHGAGQNHGSDCIGTF